jgi:serine/threonine protein phosphatase 1
MRKIAISDIHGHPQTFLRLLDRIALSPDDELYLLGDFVNKGPDSDGVLDQILSLYEQGFQVHCVRGNHEQVWLVEYEMGIRYLRASHRKFLDGLSYYLKSAPFWFVHAGFNCQIADPFSDFHAMLTLRNWRQDIDLDWLGKRVIVHGHVRRSRAEIEFDVALRGPIIDIDNGCFDRVSPGQGSLCALDLTNWNLWFQENIDHKTSSFLHFPQTYRYQAEK